MAKQNTPTRTEKKPVAASKKDASEKKTKGSTAASKEKKPEAAYKKQVEPKVRETQQFKDHAIKLKKEMSKNEAEALIGRYFTDESQAPNKSGVIVSINGWENSPKSIEVKYCDDRGNWSAELDTINEDEFENIRVL